MLEDEEAVAKYSVINEEDEVVYERNNLTRSSHLNDSAHVENQANHLNLEKQSWFGEENLVDSEPEDVMIQKSHGFNGAKEHKGAAERVSDAKSSQAEFDLMPNLRPSKLRLKQEGRKAKGKKQHRNADVRGTRNQNSLPPANRTAGRQIARSHPHDLTRCEGCQDRQLLNPHSSLETSGNRSPSQTTANAEQCLTADLRDVFEQQRQFTNFQHKAQRHIMELEKNLLKTETVNRQMASQIEKVKTQLHLRQLLLAKQAALARKQISDKNQNTRMLGNQLAVPSHLRQLEYELLKLEKQHARVQKQGLSSHKHLAKLNDAQTVEGLIRLHERNQRSTQILQKTQGELDRLSWRLIDFNRR